MTISAIWSTRILFATMLACTAGMSARAQQQPVPPVPITNDTPAAISKPMPPETTPVPATAATPITSDRTKAQRKQQKAAGSYAKTSKSTAKARKQSNKGAEDQEKATQGVPPPS